MGSSRPAKTSADRLRPQAAGHERQHLQRLGVQQVRVVDHAHDRLVPAGGGQESKHAQPDQEPVRGRAVGHAGGHPQRLLMALGQRGHVVAQGIASRCRAANGIVDSASNPSTRSTRTPTASEVVASSSVVFPIPGSPVMSSAPPRPFLACPSRLLDPLLLGPATEESLSAFHPADSSRVELGVSAHG